MTRGIPVIVAAMLALGPGRSAAQECRAPGGRQIRVSGSAVVRLPPDRVSFSHNPDGTPVRGYRVTNRVSVTRESAAGVGELIEAAVAAGGNEASQLSFFVADPDAAQGRGLELAFAAARAKAQTLAKLAGQPLRDAVCVLEHGGGPAPMHNFVRGVGNLAETIEPGTEALTFNVDVVFALGEPGPAR